jgi:hypothetical protein
MSSSKTGGFPIHKKRYYKQPTTTSTVTSIVSKPLSKLDIDLLKEMYTKAAEQTNLNSQSNNNEQTTDKKVNKKIYFKEDKFFKFPTLKPEEMNMACQRIPTNIDNFNNKV